nr:MAG TPA: hypothetical protein [Caudoviricetes sp.]
MLHARFYNLVYSPYIPPIFNQDYMNVPRVSK